MLNIPHQSVFRMSQPNKPGSERSSFTPEFETIDCGIMSLTLDIAPELERELNAEAEALHQPAEELAQQLLTDTIRKRRKERTSEARNQRRIELLRRETAEGLSESEREELQSLQSQLDQELIHWDQALGDQLDLMEATTAAVLKSENG
ncbi:MAG: hypothetical protein ACI8UO_001226 [Verrucomicrobiales bacterium]|jgi:hypothetical protein